MTVREPVVCIHGAFIADAFEPLKPEPALERYRLITYQRRGYAGRHGDGGASLGEQADDCRELLSRLGVQRAHLVGHSFGGAVAIRLALDARELVHTLSILEPGLAVGESAQLYREGLRAVQERYREAGAEVAVDEFFDARWPGYRPKLERALPGAFDQSVEDARTAFEVDLAAVLESDLGEVDARRITQPTLVVLGAASVALHPRFGETYRLLLEWLPNAEGLIVPDASHFLQIEKPRAVATALADFFSRNPL